MDPSAAPSSPTPPSPERRPIRDRIAQHMARCKSSSGTKKNNNTNEEKSDSASSSSSSSSTAPSTPSPAELAFECNVCFDMPRDPVVTPCGHLYCWPCLYRWMKLHTDCPQCPVCKAGVDTKSVIPIYGRGGNPTDDPRHRPLNVDDDNDDADIHDNVPPRPQGRRLNPFPILTRDRRGRNPGANNAGGGQLPFGYNGFNGGGVGGAIHNAYAGGNHDFSLGNFGIFPSIFGLQMAYPHLNEPLRDDMRENQEEGIPELFAKFFLLLALMITAILTIF